MGYPGVWTHIHPSDAGGKINVPGHLNPFPAVDKYICLYVFALHARASEQLVQPTRLCA